MLLSLAAIAGIGIILYRLGQIDTKITRGLAQMAKNVADVQTALDALEARTSEEHQQVSQAVAALEAVIVELRQAVETGQDLTAVVERIEAAAANVGNIFTASE